MTAVHTARRSARFPFPGLHHTVHDPRNENHLITARSAFKALAADAEPKSASLRSWWKDNAQAGPRCGAFGGLTALCSSRIGHKKPFMDPFKFYDAIRATDRADGNVFDEGVTSVGVAKTMQRFGLIKGYSWGYTLRTLELAIGHPDPKQRKVVCCGTDWRESMFDADAEGIIRVKPGSPSVGGHFYTVGAIDLKRGLGTIRQTWGTDEYGHQDQLIPLEELFSLIHDDGEFFIFDEATNAEFKAFGAE